jgi:cell division protein ZapA
MAQVDVTINNRSYTLACADGEEARLRQLAEYVDNRVSKLTKATGMVGESRLLLLVALTLADELAEASARLGAASREAASKPAQTEALAEVATHIERLAKRIESLATRVAA